MDEGDPEITDNDLGPYQDWKAKLAELNNLTDIADFQTKLLLHIQNLRQAKREEQRNTENFEKLNNPNATEQEKEEALNDIEKNEGQQSYEKNRDKVEKAKKEMAKRKATEYRNKAFANITAKLTKYGVEENELDNQTKQEIKQLKNGEITEAEKLVEAEMRIIQKIGNKGAEKKITYFIQETEVVLKNKDEAKKENLKIELEEFIHSNNIYYQSQRTQAEALLNRFQNNQNQNNAPLHSSPSDFPYGMVISLSLLGLVSVGVLAILFSKKRISSNRPKKT